MNTERNLVDYVITFLWQAEILNQGGYICSRSTSSSQPAAALW